MRLRSYGCIAGSLQVKVKFRDHENWERQARFDSTSDTLVLLDALDRLWQDFAGQRLRRPQAVAIVLSRLAEAGQRARSLFDEHRSHDQLNAVIDSVNLRYGRNALYFGGAHGALQAAPMRIAFNHIPDLRTEDDD